MTKRFVTLILLVLVTCAPTMARDGGFPPRINTATTCGTIYAMPESANRTVLTSNFITDAAGGMWGLTPSLSKGTQVCYNGAIQTATANVALLLYFNKFVYHQTTGNLWFVYNGSWTASTDPRLADESAEGTTVTTVGPVIYASQITGTASPNGPWNTFALTSGAQINMNNGTISGGNVVALVYHDYKLFQHANWGTGEGWWFWNTAQTPDAWTGYSVSSVALSNSTYTANAPANTTIGTISVMMSDTSNFVGTLSVSDPANFKIVGNTLQASTPLSASSYSITITAKPAVVGQPFTTAALTISAKSTGTGRSYLVGIGRGAPNPAFHTQLGYYPDFTINNSYMGVGGEGEQPPWNNGYPMVLATSHFQSADGTGTAYPDPNAAANGNYNSVYANTIAKNIAPYAATIYAVRIDFEWAGNWFHWSPYLAGGYNNPNISAATWIAGFQNMVKAFRANPATANVKIAWDYPLKSQGVNALTYYPGDAYVDIIGSDMYFDRNWGLTWNVYAVSPLGLNDMAAFAAAHNKPMGFWEWADNYGDGSNITQFGNWLKTKNVAAHCYWTNVDWSFQNTPANTTAYVNAFGKTTGYTGTYWKPIPLPATKPAGY